MTILLWGIAGLLAADALLICVLLIQRLAIASSAPSILELGPLIIAAGVLVALLTLAFNLRRGRSEELLKAATDLLEKAYDALSPPQGSVLPPLERRAWLSAARLIRAAERIGSRITEESHSLIYCERREYWRAKVYDLIFPSIDGLPSSFYAEDPAHMIGYSGNVRPPLSEKSLAVLYRFVRWPEDLPDPIGLESNFTDEEIHRMQTFGPRGLGNLLAQVRQLTSGRSRT